MQINIKPVEWKESAAALTAVRFKVFVEEQHVPEELELDEYDAQSFHLLAYNSQGEPVACSRLKTDGQIGRMAVLAEYRHQGIGGQMLEMLIDHARSTGLERLYLHAQITAIDFYAAYGFNVCSDVFMDAGIPHKSMQRLVS